MPFQQQKFCYTYKPKWGGKREGAGRKKTGKAKGLPHRNRPELNGRFPVHVTIPIVRTIGKLRFKERYHVIRKAIKESCNKPDFRLIHFSVQNDHIHTICEADNSKSLTRGIRNFGIRLAKALNKLLNEELQ